MGSAPCSARHPWCSYSRRPTERNSRQRISSAQARTILSKASLAGLNRTSQTWLRRSAGDSTIRQSRRRSEEHTSELQSLMRISYAVFCLKKKKKVKTQLREKNCNRK